MIPVFDFKEELNKYKPIRTAEELEDAMRDEITDIMDLLQYISVPAVSPEKVKPASHTPESE